MAESGNLILEVLIASTEFQQYPIRLVSGSLFFTMNLIAVLWDSIFLLNFLIKTGGYDQGNRILESKIEYRKAGIEDIERGLVSALVQQGKKRKRNDDVSSCVTKGRKLVQEARTLLGHGGEACPEKKRKVEEQRICSPAFGQLLNFPKLIKRLSSHELEARMLLKRMLAEGQGPSHGNLIPTTTELFGQVASVAMKQLQALLRGDEIGRIAIHGIEGIGKTFLMKHLHNSVLKWGERFDFVFWVTFPHQFSIKRVQDAVAVALNCDLCNEDSLSRRAEILSETLAGLGNFVIFLDDVPEVNFSLSQIGIPVPPEGSESKLVLTSRSTLVSKMLDCFGSVILDRLSDDDARQLLMNEVKISRRSAVLLKDIPGLLAAECCGVPRKVIDLATRMRGIDDLHEWRNALFEKLRKL